MWTANTAFSYSRDVMALPGRINDEVSQGCNYLIKRQKAQLVTSGMDIIETMCWDEYLKHVDAVQINLFPEMDETQQKIYEVLKSSRQPVAVDIIANSTQIPIGEIVAALSEMEFEGLVVKYPGNRFHPA